MRVLVAPDKFRGTLSASAAAAHIARAVIGHGDLATTVPLADGGEGTVDAFGGANRWTVVTGPLGRSVEAGWRLDGDFAVIEMAAASGLAVAGGASGNDAVNATSRGTGELIAHAIDEGARHIIVGLGGSATTDGGAGAIEVLATYAPLGGEAAAARVEVACDVRTRFLDAASRFAPQKGADPTEVEMLGRRLERLARDLRDRFGVDVASLEGSGAAGGLAGGLAALGASLGSGFDVVARLLELESAVRGTEVVITGEGKVDRTSFDGKVVGGVVGLAARHSVPVWVVAGKIDGEVPGAGATVDLSASFGETAALSRPGPLLEEAVLGLLNRPNPGAKERSAARQP